jgi:hypothetical protein
LARTIDASREFAADLPLDSEIRIQLDSRLRITMLARDDLCFEPHTPISCPSKISDLPTGGIGTCFPATNQFQPSFTWQRG